MENKKIKIDLGFATLVVEAGNDQMKEVYVGLKIARAPGFRTLPLSDRNIMSMVRILPTTRASASVSLLIKTTRTTLTRSILASSKTKTKQRKSIFKDDY